MKIINVRSLAIPEIKVIRFGRYGDQRGYFSETFRKSILLNHPELDSMKRIEFTQCNESFSRSGTVRGLHFQWNPYMAKLVRTIQGRMIDLALDIRKGSPTLGKIIAYDLSVNNKDDFSEWIWIPQGFAHGVFFMEDSIIEYFSTGEWSPQCEAGISPITSDMDWSLCDARLREIFNKTTASNFFISEKDKNGYSLQNWLKNIDSDHFIY